MKRYEKKWAERLCNDIYPTLKRWGNRVYREKYNYSIHSGIISVEPKSGDGGILIDCRCPENLLISTRTVRRELFLVIRDLLGILR